MPTHLYIYIHYLTLSFFSFFLFFLLDIYGNVVRQKAAAVLHIEDTTGAGDCFTGAFAVAMLEGKSDASAMEWAGERTEIKIKFYFSNFPMIFLFFIFNLLSSLYYLCRYRSSAVHSTARRYS